MILPPPGHGFAWRHTPSGPALVCTVLEAVAPHCFTTRAWALGASHDAGAEGWAQVASAFRLPPSALVRMRQVHGDGVIVGDEFGGADGPLPEGDIVLASEPSRVIAVQAADCVPLLFADRRLGIVAAAHAGWRGLALGVPGSAVQALARQFGTRPADLIVAAGPSVGACCYEVGPDVRQAFERGRFAPAPTQVERWFRATPAPLPANPTMPGVPAMGRPGHLYFDGWTSAREQLLSAGIPEPSLFSAGLCTASHADLFCSYRRDGRHAGRIAGAIRAPRRP